MLDASQALKLSPEWMEGCALMDLSPLPCGAMPRKLCSERYCGQVLIACFRLGIGEFSVCCLILQVAKEHLGLCPILPPADATQHFSFVHSVMIGRWWAETYTAMMLYLLKKLLGPVGLFARASQVRNIVELGGTDSIYFSLGHPFCSRAA